MMKRTVLLDNGHGSDTAGKRSPLLPDGSRLEEWRFSRDLVGLMVPLFEAAGVHAQVIVPEENDVSLQERVARANRYALAHPGEECVFVSVHGNAAGNGGWMSAKGWSAYTTKGQNNSDRLAECLYAAADTAFTDRVVRKDLSDGDSDWEANFAVIRGTTMPSVLTENFFYDNQDDCLFMLSVDGKERIAMVHVEGVLRYFENV